MGQCTNYVFTDCETRTKTFVLKLSHFMLAVNTQEKALLVLVLIWGWSCGASGVLLHIISVLIAS